MARKKEPEKAANHERWLVSYADFITLLFAVFVTLYAMSQTDKQKVEQVAASYRSAFGVTTGASSGKPSIMKSAELLPIPSVRRSIKNPEKPKPKNSDGTEKIQATKKEFKEILVSIEKFLVTQNALEKVNVEITKRGLVVSVKEAGVSTPAAPPSNPPRTPFSPKLPSRCCPITTRSASKGIPTTSRCAPRSSPPTGSCPPAEPPVWPIFLLIGMGLHLRK